MTGILAIWNDCDAEGREHFERWYAREHLFERVSLPGFRFGRRYEAIDGSPQFFAFYEVASPAVLASPEYRFRLDHPTPATVRAMASFRGTIRTVCEQTHVAGTLAGACAVTVRLERALPSTAKLLGWLDALASDDGVVSVRVWAAAGARAAPQSTKESSLRSGADGSVGGALVVECVRRSDAERVAARFRFPDAGGAIDAENGAIGLYAFLCECRAERK